MCNWFFPKLAELSWQGLATLGEGQNQSERKKTHLLDFFLLSNTEDELLVYAAQACHSKFSYNSALCFWKRISGCCHSFLKINFIFFGLNIYNLHYIVNSFISIRRILSVLSSLVAERCAASRDSTHGPTLQWASALYQLTNAAPYIVEAVIWENESFTQYFASEDLTTQKSGLASTL